jgi:hypothetical protein
MNTKRTIVLLVALAGLVALGAVAAGEETNDVASDRSPAHVAPQPVEARPGRVVVEDDRGDTRRPELDIRKVRIVNTADVLEIRVYFPGVARTYDFPTGAVSVFADTDSTRRGAEWGHFMDFWSDHRFAHVEKWREQPTPEWGHSPEGRCVASAGIQSDKQSKLRWFEYVVTKSPGCFTAEAVRVAVSTINTGDLQPYVEYPRPAFDHLTARHAWTDWIPVGS